ncbi:hypothetical protein [Sphingomonas jatrophae]|uniref:DUF927 domain-containing protein n=1 Tax=Sphingomonas jatrophae TaxID=1166337 RepID=A0A1I6K5X9_9SPHN|nr:hypothetical protein [Sphingomonas jatrophae]SFR86651.1 hypothetical protein SAMN05192580_1364 [Sphingomonas jatrophae]
MAGGGRPDNVVAIGAALDAPIDAPRLADEGDQAPFGGRDEDDGLDRPRIPKDCPVRALGMKQQTCYYLDVQGQLIALNPRDHGKNNLLMLFAPLTHLPTKFWPRWSAPRVNHKTGEITKPSEIVGFAQDEASEALIAACGEAGIFDPLGRVRGRGAHPGKNGALVIHTGDKVMVTQRRVDGAAKAARWFDPGVIDGFVYPADAPIPRPHPDPVPVEAGERLLHILSTWQWKRPGLDAMLALGWIGQAYICGAVDWRSHIFVTGGKGTGKSTLNGKNKLLDRLLSGSAIRTGSASEAAIRQKLRQQTVPVIFDEFEQSEFNAQKTRAIIELARVASSGDDMSKGGADHQAHDFTLLSAFQFSAILMPEMLPADRSRFAVLELMPFPAPDPADAGDEAESGIDLDALKLPELGRQLQRRMIDGWPRFAETLRLYRKALERVGHVPRGQDQYGTLLACADLLLYDHAPERELVDEWAVRCAPESMIEIRDADEEHDACLTHLATSAVQARGGDERETVAAWINEALNEARTPDMGGARETKFARRLEHQGLKLVTPTRTEAGVRGAKAYRGDGEAMLAVCGEHLSLAAIFSTSRWRAGAWSQALGRVPGAMTGVKVKFDGRSLRAVCVPVGAIVDDAAGDPA